MTADERRSAFSLASIYALRMLGLFMVMPVFMLEARQYEGGADLSSVGLAMGVYGLVQAVLQIPFGMAADRIGRKRVIYIGLALLALGSTDAACDQMDQQAQAEVQSAMQAADQAPWPNVTAAYTDIQTTGEGQWF
jgi:MFS family permease